MKRRFLPAVPLCALLGGCATQNSAAKDPLRGVAASFVAARSFDRARIALQRGDNAAVENSLAEFKRAQRINQGPEAHFSLANDFNEAGYKLAENGRTPADFERAVALTQKALEEADKFIASLPQTDASRPDFVWWRASGPRDSHAWALFKAGRYAQARAQQELVLKEMAASGSKQPATAEIPLHMAEIYRALGEKTTARQQYQAATDLEPNAALRARIASGLQALEAAN